MTSQALMQDYEVEQFNVSQSAKIVSIRKKRMEKENAKKMAFHNFMNMLHSVAIVLMIAALFSSYIYKSSLVSEAKYDIFNLKSEIKTLNAKVEELSADIENQTELKNIEKIAVETLGMQYPAPEQMIYIDSTYHFVLAQANDAISVSAVNLDTPIAKGLPIKKPFIEELVSALFNTNN